MNWKKTGLVVDGVLLAAGLLVGQPPHAAARVAGITEFGSWTVKVTHPDPGAEVIQLTTTTGNFTLDLDCINGPLRLYLSEFFENDTAEMSPVTLTYSIDESLPHRIVGEGHKRYRFEIHHDANAMVAKFIDAKQIAFAIEPQRKMTVLRLNKTREALMPFLNNCPLNEAPR